MIVIVDDFNKTNKYWNQSFVLMLNIYKNIVPKKQPTNKWFLFKNY